MRKRQGSIQILVQVLVTATAFALLLTSPRANSQVATLNKSIGMEVEAGCTIVRTPTSPFLIAEQKSASFQTTLTSETRTSDGYMPKDTIVEVQPDDAIRLTIPFAGMVNVKVLSVPRAANTRIDLVRGKVVTDITGRGQRAEAGMVAHVRSADINLVGYRSFIAPGSEDVSKRQVFRVRRDSPFYKIPELLGRAVRLSQEGSDYLIKRCCPQGVTPSAGMVAGALDVFAPSHAHGLDGPRNNQCSYHPVFELLKNVGTEKVVKFETEKQFVLPVDPRNPNCTAFIGGLQPVAADSFRDAFYSVSVAERMGSQYVTKLQSLAYDEMKQTRNGVTGNKSKGMCREAVRELLVSMGHLNKDDRPPPSKPKSVAAFDMAPWLKTKGYEDVTTSYTSTNAPVGSVIVYEGGPNGHIEVKVGDSMWCSDYCKEFPRDRSPDRRVKGIYIPKGSSR